MYLRKVLYRRERFALSRLRRLHASLKAAIQAIAEGDTLAGPPTLTDVRRLRAQTTPHKIAYINLRDGDNDEQTITEVNPDESPRIVEKNVALSGG